MTIVPFYLIMRVHMPSPSFALVCGPGAAGHWGRMQTASLVAGVGRGQCPGDIGAISAGQMTIYGHQ